MQKHLFVDGLLVPVSTSIRGAAEGADARRPHRKGLEPGKNKAEQPSGDSSYVWMHRAVVAALTCCGPSRVLQFSLHVAFCIVCNAPSTLLYKPIHRANSLARGCCGCLRFGREPRPKLSESLEVRKRIGTVEVTEADALAEADVAAAATAEVSWAAGGSADNCSSCESSPAPRR